MKIWLCVESFKPMRWAVRAGNKWHVVKKIVSKITLRTANQRRQPYAYLYGFGDVGIKNQIAYLIERNRRKP